jgi:HTH-type transcriptional regulator, transcriptional repressor of NAD biosynthesis genes
MSGSPAPLRVVVFGPESTGKTWLAERLAREFGEPWAPEFVREFWDRRAGHIAAADLTEIAHGQRDGEERAAARARRVVFCDTDLLTNVLWADLLFPGACPQPVRAQAEERSRRYALYLLCQSDLPFTPDPQRCFPDEAGRAMGARLWRSTLEQRGLPTADVSGHGDARVQSALVALRQRLGLVPLGAEGVR